MRGAGAKPVLSSAKGLGRGDSKRDIGTWTVFEMLGLILAGGRLRILWERQGFFFSKGSVLGNVAVGC